MMTKAEIERRKEKLRRDPATARLCAKLGVTVERYLEDIEHAHTKKLFDNQPPGREAERIAEVGNFFRKAFAKMRARRDEAAQLHDNVAAPAALLQEDTTRRVLGAQD